MFTSVFFSSFLFHTFPHLKHRAALEKEVTEVDLKSAPRTQRVDVDRLTSRLDRVALHPAREVANQLKLLIGPEQRHAHALEVEPS